MNDNKYLYVCVLKSFLGYRLYVFAKFLNVLFFIQEALISYNMKQSTSREFITVN